MDWPFTPGHLLLPRPRNASRGSVARRRGDKDALRALCQSLLEPSSCQSTTRCVQELTTGLILRDANPSKKWDFKTGLGSPCSTVVGTDAPHTSVSSFTPRLHRESCLQNPQACVLCFLRLCCAYVSRWQLRHLCIGSHGSLPAVESFESQI